MAIGLGNGYRGCTGVAMSIQIACVQVKGYARDADWTGPSGPQPLSQAIVMDAARALLWVPKSKAMLVAPVTHWAWPDGPGPGLGVGRDSRRAISWCRPRRSQKAHGPGHLNFQGEDQPANAE